MNGWLTSGLAGLVFGLGLGISGMTQPDKVVGFLDLSDAWDPSLAFVMIGAIAVHMVLFRFVLRRPSPVFAATFGIPTRTDIDGRLVAGSALFGIGWGLGGYCPGPGLVAGPTLSANTMAFLGSVTAGMLLFHVVEEALRGRAERGPMVRETHEPETGDLEVPLRA